MTQTINIIELAETHGQTSYRNRADTAHPAYGFTEEGLQAFAHALLAAESKCLHQIAEPVQAQMPDPVGVAFTFETEEGGALASQVTSSPSKLPMGWCNLYTEQQVRGYVDADRTQRAAAPQAVQAAVPATNHSETPNSSTIIVPYGWKLVPDDATPEWVTNLEALPDWREAVGECIKRFLAAAPAHPAEGVPTSSDLRERLARLEAGCNAHTTPTVYEAIADSKAALDELDEARQRVGISLAATQPAAHPGHPLRDLALGVTSFLDHAGFDTSHLPAGMGAALRRLRDAAIATQPAAQGLDAQLAKLTTAYKELSGMFHDQVVAQQAAWIEWQHGSGPEAAMQWIENGLCGPGHIPDEDEPYGKEAQAWFDANRSDPFPTCQCGRPSNQLWMGHGFCSEAHCEEFRAAQAKQRGA